jgi:hypothetical protein
MTEQDLKNIEVVFAIARKELALDENQLVEIINLKRKVLELLTPKEENEELKVEK